MVWKIDNPAANESGKILWELVPYTRGRGLDLGCGPNKAFPHMLGVDDLTDTSLFRIHIQPNIVASCERLDMFGSASMDFVYSSHLLEHIEDHESALKEWWRLVKPGGHLVLYLPHRDLYPRIGTKGANPDHKHDFAPEDIVTVMKGLGGWDLLRNEDRNGGQEYSFFQVFKKRSDKKQLYSHRHHVPAKRAAVVRYGAFGDLIQAASVFPLLKAQGFHTTLYTTPRGWEVVKHDPNIDAVYLQDDDQVPNHRLPEFWAHEEAKYERFVNLSESVEGTWLALPDRASGKWPVSMRQKYLNVNYMEFTQELAEVSGPVRLKFYATEEEKAWARKERKAMGADPLIVYALSGSAVHKVWAGMDGLIARILLEYPEARIVTVGDELSQMLEAGWQDEPRVVCKAGKYTIRQTLALLDVADMVIGPETGVLNAAANLPMPKVVLLSHSSPENLTKHWTNTEAIEPVNTSCYPCHRMIYLWNDCHRDDATGTAVCQASITLDRVWRAVHAALMRSEQKAA